MKSIYLIALAFVFSFGAVNAQSVSSEEATITFSSKKKKVTGTNTQVSASLNKETKVLSFSLSSKNFTLGGGTIDKHYNSDKGYDTEQFPDISYEGTIKEDVDLTADGTYNVTVAGTMKAHGVEKEFEATGKLIVTSATVEMAAEFLLNREAFEITQKYPAMLDEDLTIVVAGILK